MTDPAVAESELLACCPEWCEAPGDSHEDTCPEASVALSKAEFVAAQEGAARAAIEAYRILLDDDTEWSDENLLDAVLVEVQEGAVCFAGIGSCGRGWCEHS